MKYSYEDLKDYLGIFPASFVRSYVVTFLMLIDLFGGITIAAGLINKDFLHIMVHKTLLVGIIIINLWGIVIFIFSKKLEEHYILFSGVISFYISIIFLFTAFRFAFQAFGNSDNMKYYMIITIVSYIVVFIILTFAHLRNLKTGYYSGNRKKKKSKSKTKFSVSSSLVVLFTIMGMLFAKIGLSTKNFELKSFIASIFCMLLSYILIMGVHNIQKYYLIKKFNKYLN